MLAYKLFKAAIFSIVFKKEKRIHASQNNRKIVDVTGMGVWHIFQMSITPKQTRTMGLFLCVFLIVQRNILMVFCQNLRGSPGDT